MIEVVTGVEGGEELVDSFEGPQVSWVTEPSGVLVIMQSKTSVWAAYAPGSWLKVRSA